MQDAIAFGDQTQQLLRHGSIARSEAADFLFFLQTTRRKNHIRIE
jgi:hypothetical protein